MNRSSKMRSSNYYSNSQLQAPGGKVGEVQHRSIQQSFTEDDGDSEAEPAFKTKNTFYELQSKCNNLEYEKIKSQMAYKNIVSELRSKNTYLEQLASTHAYNNQILAEERDKVLIILSQVREQNYELAKQIEGFKRQVSKLEHSRGQAEELDQTHLLQELNQKQDEIGARNKKIASLENQLVKLEMQNQAVPNESASILKRQISSLEKELGAVKVELDEAQKTQDSLRTYQRQKQDLNRQMKIKDHQIGELRQVKEKLEQEVERVKENAAAREKKTAMSHSQQMKRLALLIKAKEDLLQEHQNSKVAMESKVTELTVEAGRLRSQNNGLEQYNKYLQSVNAENELKRKSFQEELYKSQREISQLRTSIFNEKLENKKSLSNMRLTFQQQKIKHVELLDEKSKEIIKIRELSISSQRQNVDYEQANSRNQGLANDLQKNSQMVVQLKSENQTLKQDLKTLENKYERKHEKYVNLEKELKAEYEKRIKSLQNQVYRLQASPETKKQKVKNEAIKNNDNFFFSGVEMEDDNSLLIEQLKPQNNQVLESQRKMIEKEEKYVQRLKKQEQTIKRLQNEAWQSKDNQSRNIHIKSDIEERRRIINELQSEISRLNGELRKQRDNSSQLRRQVSMMEQKLILQLKKSQQQIENLNRSNKQLTILQKDINRLESELKNRQNEARKRQFQIESLRLERQNRHKHEKSLQVLLQSSKKTQENLQNRVKQLQSKINQSKQLQLIKEKQLRSQSQTILMKKCEQLQRQNKEIKMDYTKTLVSNQNLQQKYTKLLMKNQQLKSEVLSSKQKASTSHLLKQIEEYKSSTANYKSQIQHLNRLLIQRQRSISPHHRSSNQSKEKRKAMGTQLWLNSKPEHDYERNSHSTIIINRRKKDDSCIKGERSYKY